MVDEIYDRHYQSGRASLHDGLGRAFASIARGLLAMHRFEWSAPWHGAAKPPEDAGIA